MFYCYLLKCKDGSLYCGSTKNLQKREELHNRGLGSKYVRAHGGGKIVYKEGFRTLRKAMLREIEIKKLERKEKLSLIKVPRSRTQRY